MLAKDTILVLTCVPLLPVSGLGSQVLGISTTKDVLKKGGNSAKPADQSMKRAKLTNPCPWSAVTTIRVSSSSPICSRSDQTQSGFYSEIRGNMKFTYEQWTHGRYRRAPRVHQEHDRSPKRASSRECCPSEYHCNTRYMVRLYLVNARSFGPTIQSAWCG